MTALACVDQRNGSCDVFESDYCSSDFNRLSLDGRQTVVCCFAFGGTRDSSESFVFSTWLRGSYRRAVVSGFSRIPDRLGGACDEFKPTRDQPGLARGNIRRATLWHYITEMSITQSGCTLKTAT